MNINKFYHYKNFVIALLIMVFYKVGAQPVPPQGYVWESVSELSDEFDFWDASKWHKPLWNYPEPNFMVNENSGVTGGNLWIKASLGSGDRWFVSSRVQSGAQIKYPMYTECRMKASSISALNTFWMNNGDGNNRDEIDICENNAAPTGNPSNGAETPFINASNWWYAENGTNYNGNSRGQTANNHNSTKDLSPSNPLKGVKLDADYHIIGCYWLDEKSFEWWLDGEKVGETTLDIPQVFTRNQNIIWDLWTNPHDGFPAQSDLLDSNINTMYVDWVHTYKLKEDDSNLPDKIALSNPNLDIESMMSYQFDVNYSTTNNNREILVSFWKGTTWLGAGVVDVNPGQNQTQQVTVNLNNLPVPGNDYVYKYHIRPRGTDYNQATDQGEVANIIVRETLSVDDSNLKEFKMYPSPVRDFLHIIELESETSVSIFDYTGRQLIEVNTEYSNSTNINVSNFQSGTYFVKISGYNVKRFIVE